MIAAVKYMLPIIRSPQLHRPLQNWVMVLGMLLFAGLALLEGQWPGSVPTFIPIMVFGVTALTPIFWRFVPARCPQCQGKMYQAEEKTVSENDSESIIDRAYQCTTCGHKEIVRYKQRWDSSA